uniref:Uncharacterized protein n=1 Tax=Caenorhabditis japonica TaxID=281687 RepID=A0A8R1E7F9_CAEJA
MDYHCDIPLVLTLFKPDFVGINQFTNCADNFSLYPLHWINYCRLSNCKRLSHAPLTSPRGLRGPTSASLPLLSKRRILSGVSSGSCRTSRRLSYQRTADTSTPLAFREVLSSSLALGPRQL